MLERKNEVEEREAIKTYIDKPESEEFYINAFEKYQKQGGFVWVWSSWALWGGVFFLLYRKLYLEAIVFFAISLIFLVSELFTFEPAPWSSILISISVKRSLALIDSISSKT